jgi:two-component system OmpR family response regulator
VRVLVVDDEDDIRRIARLSLAGVGGMDVVEANGGPEGIRKAREEPPDIILLDMMMPGMDGVATLRALRADPETSGIPVVFLTAKAMTSEVDRLKGLGARGVLIKPFDPMALPRLLRELLPAGQPE